MRIATWNVNSIKVRLPLVVDWLSRALPDVLLLQETKCEASAFPIRAFDIFGYRVSVVGQKGYNGVALLSKEAPTIIHTRLPGEPEDEQSRYIEADIGGVRIASVYAPNGNPVDSEKFAYKLRWLDRMTAHVRTMLNDGVPFALGGDWNIIPEPRDAYDPNAFADDAAFRPETRRRYRTLINLGLTDAYRALHDDERAFTFWDYQAGAWPRDAGLRIDHFLLSPQAADSLVSCIIDRTPRAQERASDHTPVVLELSQPA